MQKVSQELSERPIRSKNGQMKIGAVIRALRSDKSLTLETLASVAAVDSSYLARIERGQREPSLEMLERIGGALGTRVSTIFALAEAEEGEPTAIPSAGWEGLEDMAFRREYLTLNSENRCMALELLRTMNRVQAD